MPQFIRIAERTRPVVGIIVDGKPAQALAGDTVLTALLVNGNRVRESEFGDGPRAGHCVMGACQDCWVWLANGERIRACSTYVSEGLSICTRNPEWPWLNPAS